VSLPDEQVQREKLREISALPAKDIIRNKARVCPPISAVCEILDNVFDNYEENGSRHDLSISFIVTTGIDGQISIAENSGGVQEAKLQPLVRLGVAYHAHPGSIGTWGEGLKVAAFSLGDEVEIVTHYSGEEPVAIHFDYGWLDSQDWNVPVYAARSESIRPGSTHFRIRHLTREVDWTEIMREVGVIYGHKIQAIVDGGKRVRIEFDVDGKTTPISPRPLASLEALRKRMAFPPDFSPRQFLETWRAEHGLVKCKLIVALTPRHSTETSGVYMYGNGRMFARALRTRTVGYGEGGNSVLRDHPLCWRIHAYAFFEAEYGADIPWQAPLKDGVSENHMITARFREMFRSAVAPYARFAKIAKASELVPFTAEYSGLTEEQRAEVIYGRKSSHAVEMFHQLPEEIQEFKPPEEELEVVRVDGTAGEQFLHQLDAQAKVLRQAITRRDAGGPLLETDVLRALYPRAFADEPRKRAKPVTKLSSPQKKAKVTVEVPLERLRKLKAFFRRTDESEAVLAAVAFAVSAASRVRRVAGRRKGR
jgi:hypothetical protein